MEFGDEGVDLALVVAITVVLGKHGRRWIGLRVDRDDVELASSRSQLIATASTKDRQIIVGCQSRYLLCTRMGMISTPLVHMMVLPRSHPTP